MRFIHLADTHLAAVPESGTKLGEMRAKEIYQTFYKVIERCEAEQIDLLLIAGDMFHRAPLVRELKEINYHFGKLTHTKVVIIAGNHDYIGIHSNYLGFEWAPQVTFFYENTLQDVYFEEWNTRVYGLSFRSRDWKEAALEGAKPQNREEISILLAHGGEPDKLPMDKKALEKAGFDYIALGHIHTPLRLSERMAYVGSMEPLDKNETGERGYLLGEIAAPGEVPRLEFVPAAQRNYQLLEIEVTPDMTNGAIGDICEQQMEAGGMEHMYRICLRGKRAAELVIDREMLFSLGIVLEVSDETMPDFDFEQLAKENSNNILGMYIQRILEEDMEETQKRKVLDYGVEALLAELHRK